jgi:uncharacterized peroxidase-related enzyme
MTISERRACKLPFIKTIDESEATGKIKEVYRKRKSNHSGKVSNIAKIFSLRPDLLEAQHVFSRAIQFGGSSLGVKREEMVSVLVGALLKCSYWTVAHGEFLRKEIDGDYDLVMAIARDFRQARLDAKDKAMLEYAEKITVSPSEVNESDVQKLKQAGWNEVEILDIAALTSYRNFITRIADALGVQLSDDLARLRKDYLDTLMVGKKLL